MIDHARMLQIVVAAVALALLLPPPAAGQYRTPWGDPDLQGLWANDVVTPLERPAELGERLELTDEELAEVAAANERRRLDDGGPRPGDPILLQGYNQFWMPDRDVSRQTSLVVDPPDGRVPPLTPAGARREALALESSQGVEAKVAELRRHKRRSRGPQPVGALPHPRLAAAARLLQQQRAAPADTDHVVIHMEMIHEDARDPARWPAARRLRHPPVARAIRAGRWEGDTLVVETANFSDKTNFKGSQSGAAPAGAVHARGWRDAAVRGDRDGSGHLGAALGGALPDPPYRRPALRVRLPRRQLRHVQHPGRREG